MSSYEEKEKEFYPRSSLHRPKELDIGGSGDYCCIPLCKNSTYDRDKIKTGIGFFSFPSDPELKKRWVQILSKYRRKGGADTFSIKKSTKVCEFHFSISCINVSFNTGKKSLVKGSVPSIFKFKQVEIKKKRKSPTKRFVVESESETSEYDESSTSAGEISDIYNNDDIVR